MRYDGAVRIAGSLFVALAACGRLGFDPVALPSGDAGAQGGADSGITTTCAPVSLPLGNEIAGEPSLVAGDSAVVVAWSENDDLVMAILDPDGALRVGPVTVSASPSAGGVALARTVTGYLAAWGDDSSLTGVMAIDSQLAQSAPITWVGGGGPSAKPALAATPTGATVAWPNGSGQISLALLDPAGAVTAGPFLVGDGVYNQSARIAVVPSSDQFAIGWRSSSMAHVSLHDGTGAGGQIQQLGANTELDVTARPDEIAVVAESAGTIEIRRTALDGSLLDPVDSLAVTTGEAPRIVVAGDGYVVTYAEGLPGATQILAQRLEPDGRPVGPAILVVTAPGELLHATATFGDTLVIAWTDSASGELSVDFVCPP